MIVLDTFDIWIDTLAVTGLVYSLFNACRFVPVGLKNNNNSINSRKNNTILYW